MQNTNESIGMQIATLREQKAEIQERLEPLLDQAKKAHTRGEDLSCADYEITVRGGGGGTTRTVVKPNEDRIRDLECLLPSDLYQSLWTVSTHETTPKTAVYVKRRQGPRGAKSKAV